jgi:hypothetical protein
MTDLALTKLWKFAEAEARRTGSTFSHALDPIGLILFRPPRREGYESTPINSLAFATTGGDGVHYSLLTVEGEASDQSPVVMTVPMNFGKENMIVGSDIREFLSLGCQVGYFALEQLTYVSSGMLYWLDHPEEWFEELSHDPALRSGTELQRNILQLLRRDLDLEPWEQISERLQLLHHRFFPLLQFQEGEFGAA